MANSSSSAAEHDDDAVSIESTEYIDEYSGEEDENDDHDEEEEQDGHDVQDETDDDPYIADTGKRKVYILPKLVREELERRNANKITARGPPNLLAIHELRRFFETKESNSLVTSGFISLMRDLGAVPHSKDHLVKNPDHNICRIRPANVDSEEWWDEQAERHQAEVRLLRYGEFIEMQQTRGLGYEKEWLFAHWDNYQDGEGKSGSGQEKKEDGNQSKIDDHEITAKQWEAIEKEFVHGFHQYVNHDNSRRQDATEDSPSAVVGNSLESIVRLCQETSERYKEQSGPLGPSAVPEQPIQSAPTKKISGKQNRKRQRQQRAKITTRKKKDHPENIKKYIHALCSLLDKELVVRPSSASAARIASAIVDMLRVGLTFDRDIARCFVVEGSPGDTVLLLRSRSLEFALEAGSDATRPGWAADEWWRCHYALTIFLAEAVFALSWSSKVNRPETVKTAAPCLAADEKHAIRFFETDLVSTLLASVKSQVFAERCAALDALSRIVEGLPWEFSTTFVKRKDTWDLLEECCRCDLVAEETMATKSLERRQERYVSNSAASAIHLLNRLFERGMRKDDSSRNVNDDPGPLAKKMFQRGIVTLLMDLAKSKSGKVAFEATRGLAQMSRAKECRAILSPKQSSVGWLQDALASSEGNKVSQTMLLIVNLLRDDIWYEPILSMDPPIEETAVKWGSFCMEHVRVRADEIRSTRMHISDDLMAKTFAKMSLGETVDGEEAKENFEAKTNALDDKLRNFVSSYQLETNEQRDDMANATLTRCLFVLNAMSNGTKHIADRILEANGLSLAAACLDVPIDDTNSTAASIITNYIGTASHCPPSVFPDPEHIVSAAISRLGKLVSKQDLSKKSLTFVRLLNTLRKATDWAPYVQACGEQDEEQKYVIDVFLPRIEDSIPSSASTNEEQGWVSHGGRKVDDKRKTRRSSRNKAGVEVGGKLYRCDACGKIENKEGLFKSCSLCFVAKYCGRK